MKHKTHSGLKKRVKVKRSGVVMMKKACKNHLLDNKSKKQKGAYRSGMPVHPTLMQALRRLLPGQKINIGARAMKSEKAAVEKPVVKKVKAVKKPKAEVMAEASEAVEA